jgi:hypothetical protein
MKNRFILAFVFLILGSRSFAQVATPEWANYYYGITVQDGSGYVLDQSDQTGRMTSHAYHGGTNQQWAVMPLFITAKNDIPVFSTEFVMGSLLNGKVVDISNGSAVQCFLPFHGGTNQFFTLFPHGANVYAIRSPDNSSRVFDRSNNSNTINFYAPWHQGGSQRFLFSAWNNFPYAFGSLQTKNLLAIPFPAAPTSFSQQMPIETPRTFIQETLLPYHFINNDLPPAQQIEYSPYYKVVQYQYYRAASGNWDVVYLPGIQIEHTIRVKNGVEQSKVTEVSTKLNLSFSAAGEITATVAPISMKGSSTWSAAYERSVKIVTSFTETNEIEETFTRTIDVPTDIRIVTYQLVDYYEMYRASDATTPIMTWEVGRNQTTEINYQGNSSGGRTAGNISTTRNVLENGKMIPLTEEVTGASALSDATINVSPNPSSGIYTLGGSAAIQSSVSIMVCDQVGKILYQEQRSATSINGMIINLSDLRPGHYVLKLAVGDKVITKLIVRE